ncbi:hypothetical protein DIQ79_02510 [Mycolicibacterium smegmatis]|uniref:Uncharacterized protein n=1 Tax=Mycolicibacterium smegmatis (strain ATCC 700084 / mc(2)155) TaxID=246196 RepID=A0R602_MYCS2|nr:hypothetical protein MSMEG_6377 [Mycolicibacterium smegmatis MC2 155]TBM51199.1 hypothetical protein DIQ86_05855 [Mycolicibacterium smegmatis]TBH45299.1 hypothetical protein EYS45_13195 [Mycolicibacterium smegmatis MC2 155]TBM56348.1 hypothetical protein DIQ85_02510 [Mycolicibacterium smegmatis]TBM67310.1 hypothetical protein DIQ83_02510 [Mycolicibacterium smegmatis]
MVAPTFSHESRSTAGGELGIGLQFNLTLLNDLDHT